MILSKPPHGQPCNGCGLCCQWERCPLASYVFGPGDCCPALQFKDIRTVCGLMDSPERYAPDVVGLHGKQAASDSAAVLIGAGNGCDAALADEFYDPAISAKMVARLDHAAADRAFVIWNIVRPA